MIILKENLLYIKEKEYQKFKEIKNKKDDYLDEKEVKQLKELR